MRKKISIREFLKYWDCEIVGILGILFFVAFVIYVIITRIN